MALDFEFTGAGITEYFGGSIDAAPAYPFWLSCWATIESGGAQRTLFGLSAAASNTNLALLAWSTGRAPQLLAQAGGAAGPISGTVIAVDTWTHILGVYRGAGDRELYVNGATDGTSAVDIGGLPTVDLVTVGSWWTVGFSFSIHDGKVCQCIIGRGDIGQADISMLAAKYTPHYLSREIREGIVGYYPFRDPAIDRRDHSGNGHQLLTLGNTHVTYTGDPPGMQYGGVADLVGDEAVKYYYSIPAAYLDRKRRTA